MNLKIVSISSVAEVNLSMDLFFIYNIIETCKKVSLLMCPHENQGPMPLKRINRKVKTKLLDRYWQIG